MTLTSFFPNHARAFIVSPPSRTLKCGVTSAGASPNFYIPSCVQKAQQEAEQVAFGTYRLKSVRECLHGEVSEELWGKGQILSRRPLLYEDRPR